MSDHTYVCSTCQRGDPCLEGQRIETERLCEVNAELLAALKELMDFHYRHQSDDLLQRRLATHDPESFWAEEIRLVLAARAAIKRAEEK